MEIKDWKIFIKSEETPYVSHRQSHNTCFNNETELSLPAFNCQWSEALCSRKGAGAVFYDVVYVYSTPMLIKNAH